MKIAIGADHAGFQEKNRLAEYLRSAGHEVVDCGTDSAESTDYPEYAARVAEAVASGQVERGVLVCGTGIGMSMAANKINNIRAAACQIPEAARFSRAHNDANVLCLGARLNTPDQMREIADVWFRTGFDGGRHARRIGEIRDLETSRPVTRS
jgi:ribose 5-phosphate isomerase B